MFAYCLLERTCKERGLETLHPKGNSTPSFQGKILPERNTNFSNRVQTIAVLTLILGSNIKGY